MHHAALKASVTAVICALIMSSCAEQSSFDPEFKEPGRAVTIQPDPAEIPTVVHSRFNPAPLTLEQKRDIVEEAARRNPHGEMIWFILVHSNHKGEGRLEYEVSVYFGPDSSTPRIRRGKFARVGSLHTRLVRRIHAMELRTRKSENKDIDVPHYLWNYCQVSLPSAPFGHDLDAPTTALLPFAAPKHLKDEDIVDVVGFVRRAQRMSKGGLFVNWYRRSGGTAPILPILSVKELEGGIIEVMTGVREGLLCGIGEEFKCIKENGDIRLVSRYEWIS